MGAGFYETFKLDLNLDSAAPQIAKVVSFGKDNTTDTSNDGDSFGGEDLIQMTDSSGAITVNKLAGNYGVQMDVRLKFTNNTGLTDSFNVVMASTGGVLYPFVSLDGVFACPNERIEEANTLMRMIDLGVIENGKSVEVNFFTGLTAVSSAPLIIGVIRD